MKASDTLLLLQLASTWGMVGVIWLVQLVQYPLFARVGAEAFPAYHAGHSTQITWVVMPLMTLELAGAALLAWRPPAWLPPSEARLGLVLAAGLWASTAFLQVHQHARLAHAFDPAVHLTLVRGNWLRTLLWSLRGGLVLGWVARRL